MGSAWALLCSNRFGVFLKKNLSSFHLFNFLPPSLLFIYLEQAQLHWAKCVTMLDISPHQGWIPPDKYNYNWAEACRELWWSHNLLQKRDGWNLQKCIFTGSVLCSSTTLFSLKWTQSGKFPTFHPTLHLCQELKQLYRQCSSAAGSEALVGWAGMSSRGQEPGGVTGKAGIW